jgi:hypothetical protein
MATKDFNLLDHFSEIDDDLFINILEGTHAEIMTINMLYAWVEHVLESDWPDGPL